MNRIVYQATDGRIAIVHPAPWARLCSGATVNGVPETFSPPIPLDNILRQGSAELMDKLNPIWAETEAEFIARIMNKDVPKDAINVSIVDKTAIPVDRTFREAWTHTLDVDMLKARAIHRDHMRLARKSLLAELDTEYMRADEAGDTAAKAIVAKRKQELRDVTKHPGIEAAHTVDMLKAVWPECLKVK